MNRKERMEQRREMLGLLEITAKIDLEMQESEWWNARAKLMKRKKTDQMAGVLKLETFMKSKAGDLWVKRKELQKLNDAAPADADAEQHQLRIAEKEKEADDLEKGLDRLWQAIEQLKREIN